MSDTPRRTPKPVTVRPSKQLHDGLDILTRGGQTASDAIRYAVRLAERMVFDAWSQGLAPVGELPDLKVFGFEPDEEFDHV